MAAVAASKPNQIARETMPACKLMQTRPAVEKFFGKLTLELWTETPMPSHGLSSNKPTARSNSYLPGYPVLRFTPNFRQSGSTFDRR
jgi:hypothetical protein